MTRARNSANLASQGNLFVDITNDRTGIGSVVPAQNLHVAGTAGFHADVTFTGDNARSTFWDRSTGFLKFNDNAYIKMGTSNDMSIYHDGTNNIIAAVPPQNLLLQSDDLQLQDCSNSHPYVKCVRDSYVRLYHDNSTRFQTAAYGVNVTGTTDTDGLVVSGVATVTTMNVTGVLTYEDVTSVDAVGIITARQGVSVTGGDLTINTAAPTINLTETNGDPDYRIFCNGGIFNIVDVTNTVNRIEINSSRTTLNNPTLINDNILYILDSITHWGDTDTKIRFPSDDTIQLETGGSNRLVINSSGNATFSGNLTVSGNLSVTGTTTQNNSVSTTEKTITLASGSANNAAVDGAGIVLDAGSDTDKTLKWLDSTDRWTFTGGDVAANAFYGDGSNLTGITQTTINNNANNRVITGSGTANTLEAEANLTFTGQTLTAHMSTADPAVFVGDSNRTGAGQHVAEYRGYWDGNQIGRIVFAAGDDTVNKDDGIIKFHTTPSGGSITERLRITSDGKVGVNEASNINGRLHVQHDALAENILYATRYNDQSNDKPILAITEAQMTGMTAPGLVIGNHNRDIHIGSVFGSSAQVVTGSIAGLRITGSGQLLIGTTDSSLGSKLVVDTDISVIRSSSDPTLNFVLGSASSPTKLYRFLIDDDDSDKFQLRDLNTARITMDGSGNVGINITSPREKLDVTGGRIILDQGYQLTWANGTTNRARIHGDSGSNFIIETGSSNDERLRITSVGRIGIHQTSPAAASLHIGNSVAHTSSNIGLQVGTIGSNRYLTINHFNNQQNVYNLKMRVNDNQLIPMLDLGNPYGTVGHGTQIKFSGYNDSEIAAIQVINTATNSSTGVDMAFRTGGTSERLRITGGGLVLIGTDSNRTINSHIPRVQVTGTTYSHSTVSVINNEANGNGAYLFLGKQRSGAVGGSSAVQEHDIIGQIRFNAGDGTDMENYVGQLEMKADANAQSNNTPGYFQLYTTNQNGSSDLKMRVHQNSNNSRLFSMGTGSSHLNNASTPDRTSMKVGASIHIDSVFGHNANSGMYYNCYSGGNDIFYRGTNNPSGGDWRAAAQTMRFGAHYFYGDPSNNTYSAQAQISTMQMNMLITREGYVRKPYAPAFDVVKTVTQNAGANTKIVFNSALTNVGNHYNTSTGLFTAPTAGTYFFSMFGMSNNIVTWYNFRKNGSVISPQHGTYQTNGTDWASVGMSIVIVLAANDTMAVYTGGDSRTGLYGGGNNHNGFCGYMLG